MCLNCKTEKNHVAPAGCPIILCRKYRNNMKQSSHRKLTLLPKGVEVITCRWWMCFYVSNLLYDELLFITIYATDNAVILHFSKTKFFTMNDQNDKTPNQKAPHILNASSNLLGICFVILTSLKLLNISKTTIIDEVATIDIVAFTASCLLSFLSLRSNSDANYRLEKIADIIFIAGISLLFITALLFTFDIIA